MQVIGFQTDIIDNIFQIIAAIIHLGNIQFKGIDTKLTIINRTSLELAALYLNIDVDLLENSLLKQEKVIRNEQIIIQFNLKQADNAKHALAKFIYSKTFDYILSVINSSLNNTQNEKVQGIIGILDIFGFEIFPINSFEQLCINYTNEKLQQHFNHHIFQLETSLYQEEDVYVENINYINNEACLLLIEQIFLKTLDEEMIIPNGSDLNLCQRFISLASQNSFLIQNKLAKVNQFTIKHYAGQVTLYS